MVWGLFSPRNWRGAAAWAAHVLPAVQREGASHRALQVKYCQEEEKEEVSGKDTRQGTANTNGNVCCSPLESFLLSRDKLVLPELESDYLFYMDIPG